jgi:hypothetical protein
MALKENINRIHVELSNSFEDVKIVEGSSHQFGEFIEITTLNEGKELVMILNKRELEDYKFNWKYYSNPTTKDYLVERTSTIDGLLADVNDIFNKGRFDSDYLNSI